MRNNFITLHNKDAKKNTLHIFIELVYLEDPAGRGQLLSRDRKCRSRLSRAGAWLS